MHFCHSIPLVWMSAGDVLHLCLCISERCPTLTSFVGHEQFRSLARFLLLVVIVVFRLHNTAITIYHRRSLPCSLEHDIGSWLWFRCNAIESAKLCCGGGMEREVNKIPIIPWVRRGMGGAFIRESLKTYLSPLLTCFYVNKLRVVDEWGE